MSKKKSDNWMQTLWRPMMGWMYMLICLLDMAVFPVLWALWQGVNHAPITQWNPLTLQGAGLFHIAMGAVLGISAFGRTQEKLAGTAINPSATSQTVTNNQNITGNQAGGFGSGQGGMGGGMGGGFGGGMSGGGFGGTSMGGSSFGAPAGGFGSPAPAAGGFGSTSTPAPTFSTTPATTAAGKPAGPAQSFPPM